MTQITSDEVNASLDELRKGSSREKRTRKSAGILTDPSKTFKIVSKGRVSQFRYDQLPGEFKNKKKSILDFLGGSFLEVNTLLDELSLREDPCVLLYISGGLFIPAESEISPHELVHQKKAKNSRYFQNWIISKDMLIVSLSKNRLIEFLDLYQNEITRAGSLCVILTGKSVIDALDKHHSKKFIFMQRRGVARFGAANRKRILALMEGGP
jgi:hypothetical protein